MKYEEELNKFLENIQNLDDLLAFVESKSPEIEETINAMLFEIVSLYTELDDERLQKCIMLLKAGASPNYIDRISQTSVLQAAAQRGLGNFIEILFQYGAHATQYIHEKKTNPSELLLKMLNMSEEEFCREENKKHDAAEKMSMEDKNLDMVMRKKLPLQKAIERYLRYADYFNKDVEKACRILKERTQDFIDIDELLIPSLKNLYQSLAKQCQQAYKEAKSKNQQLIIIVGESHIGIHSLIVELMLMDIAKAYGINTLLTEHNRYIHEHLNEHESIPTNEGCWSASMTVNAVNKTARFNKIPVDLGHWGAQKTGDAFDAYENLKTSKNNFNNTSSEGIRYRNEVISTVIQAGIPQDALLFVGAGHLSGLLEDTTLSQNKYIHAILAENLNLQSAGKDEMYAMHSPRVSKVENLPNILISLLTPEEVVNYVDIVADEYRIKNNYASSEFEQYFSWGPDNNHRSDQNQPDILSSPKFNQNNTFFM